MISRITIKSAPLFLCGLLAAGAATTALAQSSTPAQALLDNKFVFNLGTFVLQTDLKAGLNGQSSSNPEIDFDKTFGLGDSATRVRADALWRITPTHHVRFLYFANNNDRTRVLNEPIKWGDYTFQAGSNVRAESKASIYELAYEYAWRMPTYEVAAGIGVHYMDISLQLSGAATVTGPTGSTSQVSGASKKGSLPAPLPVIGLRGGWVVAPNWYVDAQGQFFKVNVNGYDGNWTDLRVGATWMFNRNFGLGLGYNWFHTNVDVNRSNYNGSLGLGYSGLQAFLTGTF